jgi:hypothetical protein
MKANNQKLIQDQLEIRKLLKIEKSFPITLYKGTASEFTEWRIT